METNSRQDPDAPPDPKPFRLAEGGGVGFVDGEPVPVVWPIDAGASPEMELAKALGEIAQRLTKSHFSDKAKSDWIQLALPQIDEFMQRVSERRSEASSKVDVRTALKQILGCLTDGAATPLQAGQRAFCLQHNLKLGEFRTSRELAESLGISAARVCQIRRDTLNVLNTLVAAKTLVEIESK
jgi:hypothetical protein